MNERRWDAVIFDMDGVLCDSEPLICEAACRMFQETHGAAVRPEDFAPFVGMGENRYLGGVAEKYGVTLRLPEDKARVYAIYLDLIAGRLRPLPGARAFVTRCRSLGLKTAVATSADRIKMDGNLREIGLAAEAFDALVYGELVTHKKPDPEIFLTAARLVGIAPARCLVVEDALSGVAAAKAAGAECLALTSSFEAGALRAAGADYLARDLAEAMPRLDF